MKKISKILIVSISIILFLVSCKESSGKKQKKDTNIENEKTDIKTVAVLNANLATESDLIALGLSSELIAKIIAFRPYESMTDFNEIIKGKDTEELFKKIFVPFNLNTTAEVDFKMIPGIGNRIAHEFEEYRPYTSIKQFKREIGKYVDENEVSRYLNYVFVPVELNTSTEDDIKSLPGVGNRISHEFIEYRPYKNLAQFRKEIGKYVDKKELKRLERFVYLK
jgi:DNA uptake protein ComE-like DNA-binding protein|tara:strand:- start:369 stop:1037 length:669 start_codon:yes stop_codon:yes gene_type:complete